MYSWNIVDVYSKPYNSKNKQRGYVYYRYATGEMDVTSRNGCEIFGRNSNG